MSRTVSLPARWFAAGYCLLACGAVGCRPASSTPAAPAAASEGLERMLEAYRQAETYQDGGQVRLGFQRTKPKQGEDAKVNQAWDYSIALQRPNKLRLHVYQAVAVCDGKQLHATLNLEQVAGQVHLDHLTRAGRHIHAAADPAVRKQVNVVDRVTLRPDRVVPA